MLLIDIAKKLYNKNEIKDLVSVCNNFLHEVPSKLEIQCKKGMYFNLIFVGILSILILSVPKKGDGGGQWGGGS